MGHIRAYGRTGQNQSIYHVFAKINNAKTESEKNGKKWLKTRNSLLKINFRNVSKTCVHSFQLRMKYWCRWNWIFNNQLVYACKLFNANDNNLCSRLNSIKLKWIFALRQVELLFHHMSMKFECGVPIHNQLVTKLKRWSLANSAAVLLHWIVQSINIRLD